jgi:hypothetical protein
MRLWENDPTADKENMVMPLADGGPDLPTSRHNNTDGTPPSKPYGLVMSHQQENRFILSTPLSILNILYHSFFRRTSPEAKKAFFSL